MGDSEDPMGINDKIEILSTDDDRIKAVGELLSSDSSRSILKLLFNESMTANQISQKTEISLPLVMYHLKKMQDTGVVKISQTGKNTKSHDMKFYTVDKFAIVILPSGMSEKAKSSKSLFNSFNRIYRFATIGGVALTAWFSSQFIQQNNRVVIPDQSAIQDAQLAQNSGEASFKTASPEAGLAMKSAPVENTGPQSDLPPAETPSGQEFDSSQYAYQSNPQTDVIPQPTGGETHFITNSPVTGDPSTDIYISLIITLGVVIIGLIIERIIRSRRK